MSVVRVFVVVAAAGVAAPVHALSCQRPDMVRSWQARAGETVVLLGTFDFDAAAFDRSGVLGMRMPDEIDLPARFRGRSFPGDTALTLDVTLRSVCYANWCGAMGPGRALVFAELSETGLRVALDPCGMAAFPDPSEADLDRLAACIDGGACAPGVGPPR